MAELEQDFIEACREVAARGLVRCSSGNMSCRFDDRHLLATTTGSWMSRLSPDDIAVCAIADGSVCNGKEPTAEIHVHAGILRMRPDVNVVLHFQAPWATALACQEREDINYFVIPEIPFYIGRVAQVPYFMPGSRQLAEAVTKAMEDHNLVVLRQHGQVTVARDFNQVLENAEFFELACKIILRGGRTIRHLSAEAVKELMALRSSRAKGV